MSEYEIKESTSFVTIVADSAAIIGTIENDEEIINIVFTKNTPVICVDEKGGFRVKMQQKQKVASLNLTIKQANGLYEALKLTIQQSPSFQQSPSLNSETKDEGDN
ncbi:hypothetical protein EHW66_08860 [Erwinia psidii]|uniref:hypothetical protein n=1 Tax=Erwinia psidii TaxID=69224 RepID=UPI00226B7E25|nr:hypothetical protein [Erwinia psidii]MCX8965116.1 hypothetical protein [Erwinia psidii]